jgi:hypothetical protein
MMVSRTFEPIYWMYKQSIILCKHLYGIYIGVFCLEMFLNLLIIQLAWTHKVFKYVSEKKYQYGLNY